MKCPGKAITPERRKSLEELREAQAVFETVEGRVASHVGREVVARGLDPHAVQIHMERCLTERCLNAAECPLG